MTCFADVLICQRSFKLTVSRTWEINPQTHYQAYTTRLDLIRSAKSSDPFGRGEGDRYLRFRRSLNTVHQDCLRKTINWWRRTPGVSSQPGESKVFLESKSQNTVSGADRVFVVPGVQVPVLYQILPTSLRIGTEGIGLIDKRVET